MCMSMILQLCCRWASLQGEQLRSSSTPHRTAKPTESSLDICEGSDNAMKRKLTVAQKHGIGA